MTKDEAIQGEEHVNTKTFEAIKKLKEVELELHRLKNALEMANKSLDAQRTWVGLTLAEQGDLYSEHSENPALLYRAIEAKLKERNT